MRRCEHSDLPADQCACHHCRPTHDPEWEATDIAYTFDAQHNSRADCGHHCHEDDHIGRTTDGQIICPQCLTAALDQQHI